MGLRIELFLYAVIIAIVYTSLTFKLNDTTDKVRSETKELEFTKTTFTTVDTKNLKGRAYGTYGVRDNNILTIYDLVYQTDNIKSLRAKKGTYIDKIVYFKGDVVADNFDGYRIKTQEANYNQISEILNITSPFVSTQEANIVKGSTLIYNTRSKEASGSVIDAVFYTSEK